MTRLRVLFLVAFIGVVGVLTIAASMIGALAVAPFLVLVVIAVVSLARRARAFDQPTGRTCTCCTSTVHDPVTVVEKMVP